MTAWTELSRKETDKVYKKLAIKYNIAKITYDISDIYECNEEQYDMLVYDFYKKIKYAMMMCLSEGDLVYYVDPYHSCYKIDPFVSMTKQEMIDWGGYILPNGDSYTFFAQDSSFAITGEWDQPVICIFGKKFLDILLKNKPKLLINNIFSKENYS